jgi:TPR repeat protein
MPRLLDPSGTLAIILGAHDWSKAGLSNAPSFRRSAAQFHRYLLNLSPHGLELEPDLILSLFDDPSPASAQLGRIRDAVRTLTRERSSEARPINDVLIYYIGHGAFNDSGHLHLLVRDSSEGIEAQSSIATLDLAHVLRVAAPQQRRLVILDCCFSEAAVTAFGAMSATLEDAVASTALKDLASVGAPNRGTLLLCSSPRSQVSIGKPNAEHTLFTGALLSALNDGADHIAGEMLSFFDLREAVYDRMLREHDAPPRPALHQPEQQAGDLMRLPAFPNVASVRRGERKRRVEEAARGADLHRMADTAARLAEERCNAPEAARLAEQRLELDEAARLAKERPQTGRVRRVMGQRSRTAFLGIGVFVALFVVFVVIRQNYIGERAAGQFARGWNYETGLGGLPKSDTNAVVYYHLAADQGNADAQYRLGVMYEGGRGGLTKSDTDAVRYYRLAAGQGNDQAQNIIGWLYENGRGGLTKSDTEAVRYYRLAADQGNAHGQNNLGKMYESGRGGLTKSDTDAVRYYRLSADQGFAWGQNNLGWLYANGRGGLTKSDTDAVRYYRLSADQGNADAQYRLGMMYESGRGGLTKSDTDAVRYYRLAADQSYAWGQYSLGRMFENGLGGLPKSDTVAVGYYRLAADQGNADAQYNLGLMYENGRGGLTKSDTDAGRYYRMAAQGNNQSAISALNRLGL